MINLLPPQNKEELLAEESKRLIIILGFIILLILLCLIIILVFLRIYLLIQIDIQKNLLGATRERVASSETQALEEKVKNFNQELSRINSFYEKKVNLTEALENLIETIPEGIYLTDLSYSKASSQIILAGFAPSRDLLVHFKKNLEAKEEFQEVYFPPSVWIEALNINFAGIKVKFLQ